jgi:MinD-like ATPase involved in chromosome partitioning or flagellar assembly
MTPGWSTPAAAPGAANDPAPVRLLIGGQPGRTQALYSAFAGDARFAVLAVATSPADVKAKLALEPEIVLVEAALFGGAGDFATLFAAYGGLVIMLAPGLTPADVESVRRAPCVAQVLTGEPNLGLLAGEMHVAILARRPAQSAAPDGFAASRSAPVNMIGWRSIAVWSPQGGVGKSTIALALALEATQRHLPTLLVVLSAPDMTPLILDGINPTPNILNWRANPTVAGLKAAVQVHKQTGLHILVSFSDPVSLGDYDAQNGPASLQNLTMRAAQAGYGLVILDISAPEIAPSALAAATTLVLVARPDLPGVKSALEGLRLVKDVMAGQHAIPAGAIYLVVNRVRGTTYTAAEVIEQGKRVRADFPPLAASVADDPNVELATKNYQPAIFGSDALRTAVRTLGNLLFPAALSSAPEPAKPARVIRIGPIRLKL